MEASDGKELLVQAEGVRRRTTYKEIEGDCATGGLDDAAESSDLIASGGVVDGDRRADVRREENTNDNPSDHTDANRGQPSSAHVRSASLQMSLEQICGLDPKSASDLFSIPGRALDRAEEMARQAWEAVDPTLSSTADLLAMPGRALDRAEEMARHAWEAGWTVIHHHHLPKWLRDNDFLVKGHRPPLNSFLECFKSIFRIHTETGNIWTHLLGFVAFIVIAVYMWTRPSVEVKWQEKAVFSAFFLGAILCMLFSWLFHTFYCHSEKVGRIFCKLDYCGIAMLIVGSFVPWLYYCFYCHKYPQIAYLILIVILGSACVVISFAEKFAKPRYRPLRAGVYVSLGLSGVIPAAHYIITQGFSLAVERAAFGWLMLMAVLYISGAAIYAFRIPECLWPGKFDIWFSSHQIFHVFVVVAALVHYHGVSEVARNHLELGDCSSSGYSSMS